MSQYKFPGFFVYLHDAAERIGHPEAEAPARKITTLSALANLCAQVDAGAPAHAPAIMAKAKEFRDQLHAAYEAAGLILEDVSRALVPPGEDLHGGAASRTHELRLKKRRSERSPANRRAKYPTQ